MSKQTVTGLGIDISIPYYHYNYTGSAFWGLHEFMVKADQLIHASWLIKNKDHLQLTSKDNNGNLYTKTVSIEEFKTHYATTPEKACVLHARRLQQEVDQTRRQIQQLEKTIDSLTSDPTSTKIIHPLTNGDKQTIISKQGDPL